MHIVPVTTYSGGLESRVGRYGEGGGGGGGEGGGRCSRVRVFALVSMSKCADTSGVAHAFACSPTCEQACVRVPVCAGARDFSCACACVSFAVPPPSLKEPLPVTGVNPGRRCVRPRGQPREVVTL